MSSAGLANHLQAQREPPSMLVVVAHPDLAHSRINAAWLDAVRGIGGLTVDDLYGRYPDWRIDVAAEQDLLVRHQRIILQFPFQWYNCPPLLKHWLDTVLTNGWAYGTGGGALKGKELGIAVSTWSKAGDYQPNARYRRTMQELTSPFEVTARRLGMRYLPGFFLNGAGEVDDARLAENAHAYVAHLQGVAESVA
ncbi:NAD(P)H-dependent oxidoreductase [Rhizobiaceae bacterium BDR2-2]|uniref:NAD(P)H-dependent oxidoreductase n=1 Tax=Ectorhizobium quercum TaxID=2965071 RepID=A0AAE3MX42_9HYPH|nr:NAD(P)H-dependent oxidoreductase [Ectorhizobium quercum]MCX8995714.1 NAD(P)H-dependent oxidoreductase [Ectorhizobium quercum]